MRQGKAVIFIVSVLLILSVFLILFCLFTVNEKELVVVTQFGKPVRVIKQAGLYLKMPGFIQKINRFDKRTDIFRTQPIQLLLGDKNPLILICYVCWRIYDPLLFFQSIITRDICQQKLSDMINSQLGSTFGDYTIDNIINTDAQQVKLQEIETKIMDSSNNKAKEKYGIEILSVGIRRINYPSIVERSVYGRMRAEREKEAKKYRAEGEEEATKMRAQTDKEAEIIQAEAYKKAEIISGEGDQKSVKIYAEAYGKDPELFEFLKSLETLKEILKEKTTLILSTDSKLLKYLEYRADQLEKK